MSRPEVDITPEELKRFEEAMKKEEFRKLLVEYAEEISNPENRKKYEDEIQQMEAERGMDIKFINPEPGHVIKSTLDSDGKKKKAFINICKNENIEKATFTRQNGPNGCGVNWSIPHSLTRPRDDLDRSGEKCTVYDVVFHTDTYRMAESNSRFKKLVHDTALDAIEEHFNVKLDKKNIKTPRLKNNYKGAITSSVLRTRREGHAGQCEGPPADSILNQMPYPYDSNKTTEEMTTEWLEKEGRRKASKRQAEKVVSNETTVKESSSQGNSSSSTSSSLKADSSVSQSTEDKPITPKYTILHRSAVDLQEFRNAPDAKTSTRPKELVISIDLPKLKSANTVDLDIVENHIMLKCTTPASYELELRLPYPVDETNGTAKFDKSKSQLNVTLPVIPAQPESLMFCSAPEDEDVSSDVDSERGASLDDGSEVSYDSPSPVADKECEDLNSDDAVMKSPSDSDTCGMLTSTDLCQLPPFIFSQDDKTVTFVIDVANVNPNSIIQKYKSNSYDLIFLSQGSGCFPIHYRLYIQFPEGCNISPEEDVLDRSEENLVALLRKDQKSQELWDGFLVGFDENNLEHFCFESLGRLEKTLEALEECCDPLCAMPQAHDTDYHLDVTELDEKHVTLDVQVTRGVSESDTTDTESHVYPTIEVIHRKRTPDLHGILKQRSRTISDSSDENGTVLSASPDSSSIESHFPSVKKSVSFNEHIDQATFKPNSTVSSMHNSMKSKRKRSRQREERKKNGRRRRRNSSQESSEGEDGHLKEKGNSSSSKGSHKGQQGKNSRKKGAAAAAASATSEKNSSKQDGAGSSSTVEETDETTNTEGSDHDSDSGYDNNDSSQRNSSMPESSSQSKNNNVDHYNLRPRRNRGSKSEPKNCHGTKNCSHSNSIVVGCDRTDNKLTSEERAKLNRLMTAALNQTLSQINPVTTDDSECLEVPDSHEVDAVGPSKAQVIDTVEHMASLSIGDASPTGCSQALTDKDSIVPSEPICIGNQGGVDNNSLSMLDEEKSNVDEDGSCGGDGNRARVETPALQEGILSRTKKEKSLDCDKKLKNINGKNGQKSELDNFRSAKIESVLSWTDSEYSKQLSNEHHTQCAFHFNNNVMFELD